MQWNRLSLGVFLAGLLSLTALAAEMPIKEGVHYKVIPGVHGKPSSNDVEVIEFFSYGCPHCYHFDPILHEWAKKSIVPIDLVLTPVTFRPGWDIYAAAYYTAELFNKLDNIHTDFYKAVQQEGHALMDMRDLTYFFTKHGISQDQFAKTIDSFGVRVKVGQAVKMATDYRITAVPTLIVNRKYMTDATAAGGSFKRLLAVLSYLAQKETKKVKRPGSN